jgi:hypothetical protein
MVRASNMQLKRKQRYFGMTGKQIAILACMAAVVFGIVALGLIVVLQDPISTVTPIAPNKDTTQRPSDVFIELTVDLGNGNRPVLVGRTNLPDGTLIMLSVDNHKYVDEFFMASDKATVENSAFRSAAFGPDSGLPEGKYNASAAMPIPEVQPSSVRAIIGQYGENLKGPFVKEDDVGITVSVDKEFQIGTHIPTPVPTTVPGSKEECDDLATWTMAANPTLLSLDDNLKALFSTVEMADQTAVNQLFHISTQFYILAMEFDKLDPKTTRVKALNRAIRKAISDYGVAAGDLAYGLKGNKPDYIADVQIQLNKLSADFSAIASRLEQMGKQCGFK